jgi:hypothetical protein
MIPATDAGRILRGQGLLIDGLAPITIPGLPGIRILEALTLCTTLAAIGNHGCLPCGVDAAYIDTTRELGIKDFKSGGVWGIVGYSRIGAGSTWYLWGDLITGLGFK